MGLPDAFLQRHLALSAVFAASLTVDPDRWLAHPLVGCALAAVVAVLLAIRGYSATPWSEEADVIAAYVRDKDNSLGRRSMPAGVFMTMHGVGFVGAALYEIHILSTSQQLALVLPVLACVAILTRGAHPFQYTSALGALAACAYVLREQITSPQQVATLLGGAACVGAEAHSVVVLRGMFGSVGAHNLCARVRVMSSFFTLAVMTYYSSSSPLAPSNFSVGVCVIYVLLHYARSMWQYTWMDITSGPCLTSTARIVAPSFFLLVASFVFAMPKQLYNSNEVSVTGRVIFYAATSLFLYWFYKR